MKKKEVVRPSSGRGHRKAVIGASLWQAPIPIWVEWKEPIGDQLLIAAYCEATGKEEVSNLHDGEQWDYPPHRVKAREEVITRVQVDTERSKS